MAEAGDTFVLGAFRGHTANFLGEVKPITGDEAPAYYPALLAAQIPYDETFLINHPQAFADYRASRYKVDLTFRMMKEDNLVTHSNEFVITLLGIVQTLPVQAAWIEHLGIFVGKQNLVEYTNYQCSQNGETSFPYPLYSAHSSAAEGVDDGPRVLRASGHRERASSFDACARCSTSDQRRRRQHVRARPDDGDRRHALSYRGRRAVRSARSQVHGVSIMAKKQPVFDLAAHNRHLAILGLPAVKTPLVEGPPAVVKPRAKAGSIVATLDEYYAGEGPTAPRGAYIHWWGQFQRQLPAPFKLKTVGHGYLEGASRARDEAVREAAQGGVKMTPKRIPTTRMRRRSRG